MHTVLLVARREFVARVRTRGFILTAIGTPLLLVILWFATGFMQLGDAADEPPLLPEPDAPVVQLREGYVDRSNLLDDIDVDAFRRYPQEADAAADLERGVLDAYYVIEEGYRETGIVRRVMLGMPMTPPEVGPFRRVLEEAVLQDVEPPLADRLREPLGVEGLRIVVENGVNDAERPPGELPMLPFLVTVVIMVPLFAGGGLLLRSVAQEKESRIMELLLSSLRPRELLAGKLLGMAALILVQYAVWVAISGGAMLLFGDGLDQVVQGIDIGGFQAALVVIYALAGFLLYAAIMAGLGAVTPDVHSSQNWVFIISLPMTLPIYLWVAIVTAPQGAVALGLSLFPFSAPIAMVMRVMVAVVPLWQIVASLLLLTATIAMVIVFMARLFRAQVLLSGEPLSASRFIEAFRA